MTLKLLLLCVGLGIAGFALAWGGWHLYVDHQALHLHDQQIRIWQQGAIEQQRLLQSQGGK